MFLAAYLKLYVDCLSRAAAGIAKNAWTLVLPMGLFAAVALLAVPLSALGPLSGMFLRLAMYFAFSSYLYFAAGIVANQKVGLDDLKKSFLAYFWSIMGLLFVVWIAEIVLGAVFGQNPNKGVILLGLDLLAFVVLNAAPEIIYTKGTRGGMDTISRSVKFVQENWIEWFVPMLLVGAAAYGVWSNLWRLPGAVTLVLALVGGAIFHLVMVFRGHLFEALDSSTHRQRMFKYGRRDA